METFYTIKVEKHVNGIKTQHEFTKLYDSDHPKLKADPESSQYGTREITKSFTDKSVLLEQRFDSINLDRILKAVNPNLKLKGD